MAPLPPLDPSNTRRLFIVYTSGGEEHNMMLRVAPAISAGTIEDTIDAVALAMAPLMDPTDNVIRVDDCAAGSNIRFPLFPIGYAGTAGSSTPTDQTKSAFISMTGKGTDGRLTRVSFYIMTAANFNETRVNLGVLGAAYVDWYNAIDNNPFGVAFRTIGGAIPTYNNYINIARSAYWQREFR